jgi:hypothetical protein
MSHDFFYPSKTQWSLTIRTTCFNILKLGILRIHCVCVFHMIPTINSDCFPKQHYRFGFVAET